MCWPSIAVPLGSAHHPTSITSHLEHNQALDLVQMSFHGLPNHRLFLALMGIEKCRQGALAGWPSSQIWPKHITSGKQCSKSAFPQISSHPKASLPALGLLVALCWDGRLKTNRLAGWPKLSLQSANLAVLHPGAIASRPFG